MKRKYLAVIALGCALSLLCGCTKTESATRSVPTAAKEESATAVMLDSGAIDVVTDIATTQYFTADPVSQEDLETIVMAGVNAPSAMNGQPWHFSVVTDAEVLEQISSGMSFGGMGFAGMPGGPGMGMPEGMEAPKGVVNGQMPEGMEFPEGFDKGQMPEGMELPERFEKPQMPEGMEAPEGFAPPSGSAVGMNKAGLGDAPLTIIVSCKAGSEFDAGLDCQNMSAAAQLLGYGSKIISSPTMALNGAKQAEYRELLGIPEDMSAVAVLLIGHADSSVDESVDGYTAPTERNPIGSVITIVR